MMGPGNDVRIDNVSGDMVILYDSDKNRLDNFELTYDDTLGADNTYYGIEFDDGASIIQFHIVRFLGSKKAICWLGAYMKPVVMRTISTS